MRTQPNPLVLGVQVNKQMAGQKACPFGKFIAFTCIGVVVLINVVVVVWSFLFREEVHMLF